MYKLTQSWPILLLVLILVAGFFYAALLGDSLRFFPDELDYLNLAVGLATGKGFTLDGVTPSAYRPPVYSALLSPLKWLGVGIPGLRMVNFLAFTLTLLVLGWMVRENSVLDQKSKSLGNLTTIALGIGYPVLFFAAGTIYPQILGGFLFVTLLFLVFHVGHDFHNKQLPVKVHLLYCVIGFVAGLLVLTIPTFLLLVFVVFAWKLVTDQNRRAELLRIGIALFSMLVIIGAWTVRNVNEMGEFVLVSTNLGDNLLRGNAAGATPNSGPATDVEAYMAQVASMNEVERDRFLQEIVFNIWRTDPAGSIQLYFGKVLNYFNYRNDLVSDSETSILRDLLMGVSYYLLLFLAVCRLAAWRIFPLSNTEKIAAGLYLFNAFYSAVVFTRIRYRLPFDYLLIFLAASFISYMLHYKNSERTNITRRF